MRNHVLLTLLLILLLFPAPAGAQNRVMSGGAIPSPPTGGAAPGKAETEKPLPESGARPPSGGARPGRPLGLRQRSRALHPGWNAVFQADRPDRAIVSAIWPGGQLSPARWSGKRLIFPVRAPAGTDGQLRLVNARARTLLRVRVLVTPSPLPTPPPVASAGTVLLGQDGLAIVPADAPAPVQAIVRAGNWLQDKPYRYGGGHARLDDTAYDCSGAISYMLRAGGLMSGSLTSGGLAEWGEPGAGGWVSIYANPEHTFILVGGLRLDTAGGPGPRWYRAPRSLQGFALRHPPGL